MQNYNNPDKRISLEEEDPPDEMIGVRRCRSGPGLFRLSRLLIAHARACFYFNVVV